VGGLGKFSHGDIGLSHQHWVEQLISGGSFGVHCTESAEAEHKICMRLPSMRVKHSRQNLTQKSMHAYLRRYTLFETLIEQQRTCDAPRRRLTFNEVQLPLINQTLQGSRRVSMGTELENTQNQQQFLHREVRIARVELLDLICGRLGLSKTRQSYQRMNCLQWTFGQKFVRENATFWATDSKYTWATSENANRRRDIFLLRGTEMVPVIPPNGRLIMKNTALCCEAVCFVQISGVRNIFPTLVTMDKQGE